MSATSCFASLSLVVSGLRGRSEACEILFISKRWVGPLCANGLQGKSEACEILFISKRWVGPLCANGLQGKSEAVKRAPNLEKSTFSSIAELEAPQQQNTRFKRAVILGQGGHLFDAVSCGHSVVLGAEVEVVVIIFLLIDNKKDV
ncbi:MAG: hypothetical protein GW921_03895 [Gallionella sp.]|nr:hypothetical protein [Gallionella sp.]